MSFDGLQQLFGTLFGAIFIVGSIYVYGTLARHIARRGPSQVGAGERVFGRPEMIVAVLLAGFFVLNMFLVFKVGTRTSDLRLRDVAVTALFSIGLLLLVAMFLRLRSFNLTESAGFTKLSFGRVVSTAIVLLVAAYPLIIMTDALTKRFLGGEGPHQEIVELFSGSQALEQRVMVILLAVAVAPLAEEFIFRYFLYGVLKRYAGIVVGVVVNAALFAAIHMHLPSFAPLFVLGLCFTLAFEWSGSILVPMTMHALFNSASLTVLAFPELLPP